MTPKLSPSVGIQKASCGASGELHPYQLVQAYSNGFR